MRKGKKKKKERSQICRRKGTREIRIITTLESSLRRQTKGTIRRRRRSSRTKKRKRGAIFWVTREIDTVEMSRSGCLCIRIIPSVIESLYSNSFCFEIVERSRLR